MDKRFDLGRGIVLQNIGSVIAFLCKPDQFVIKAADAQLLFFLFQLFMKLIGKQTAGGFLPFGLFLGCELFGAADQYVHACIVGERLFVHGLKLHHQPFKVAAAEFFLNLFQQRIQSGILQEVGKRLANVSCVGALLAIENIGFGNIVASFLHQAFLYSILYIFNGCGALIFEFGFNGLNNAV